MDASEATKIVLSRIQSLDPDKASRIMGYILIRVQGEEEMIRLAFGPDAHLLSYVHQAKAYLAANSSNPLSDSNFFSQTSPRILIPTNGFHYSNPSSPVSFPRSSPRPISYAAVLNDASSTGTNNISIVDSRFGNEFLSGDGEDANAVASPQPQPFHRRSHSVNDAPFLSHLEEGGGGSGFKFRPCAYFAKGVCKSGSSCKFFHGDNDGDEKIDMGHTSSGYDDLSRIKALQQNRFALMASRGQHSSTYNKSINFLNDNQRRGPRNGFLPMGLGAAMTSSSRQIYMTFPAESTFREEDVSSYFSVFGPVQDVRIPYQQKRMFGFVTFVYPETVKLILAKGNPHYVCDSRVLVKPYKEKGKAPDKQQHLNLEYSASFSHSGFDSREIFNPSVGPRAVLTKEMMLRRNLEQESELQHAIELQGQRMMNLQLMDLRNQQHNHQFLPNLPVGVSIASPRESELPMGENAIASSDAGNRDVFQGRVVNSDT